MWSDPFVLVFAPEDVSILMVLKLTLSMKQPERKKGNEKLTHKIVSFLMFHFICSHMGVWKDVTTDFQGNIEILTPGQHAYMK